MKMPIMKIGLMIIILAESLLLAETARELLDVDFANLPDNPGFNIYYTTNDRVAHAGDVNNDGLADLVIGMTTQSSIIGSAVGNAYVLFGRPGGLQSGIDMVNDPWDRANGITISGVLSSEGRNLGTTLGYAGDLNNDGIDDFYVSAPNSFPGVVYIIFGRSDLNDHDIDLSTPTSSDWIKITGESSYMTGDGCSRLGDVNGDTIDDFVLSQPNAESSKGVIYVIFGAIGLSSNIALASISALGIKITGESAGDMIGSYVTYAGDLNGDGTNDIVFGAAYTSPNSVSYAGTVHVIFGKPGLSDIPDIGLLIPPDGIQIMGSNPFTFLGGSIIKSGDLNGDGLNDLVITNPYGMSGAGVVYIFFGKNSGWSSMYLNSLSSSDGFQIIGNDTSALFGFTLEVFDTNEDGIDDIYVAGQAASPFSRSTAGIIYVILGNTGITDVALATFDNSQGITMIGDTGYLLGTSMLLTGDFNNDGQDDLIIGSWGPTGTYLFYTSTAQVPLPTPPAPPSESESNGYDKMIERIVDFEVTTGTLIGITTSGLQMSQSGVMAVMTGVLLAKQLQFIRYIDVEYSPRLMLTFQKQPYNLITVNFGPLFPESLEGEAFRDPASPRFARYINRLLVVNFWRGLTTFGILLIVLFAAFILRKIPIKNPILKLVRDKLQSFILLNYMFSFILSNTDNIILFSIVEYKSFKLDGGLATASFIISIFCLMVLLGILIFIPWHLYRLRKHMKYQNKQEKLLAYDSSKVLFEEVKDKYFIQQLYLFILCFRVVLHNIIIGALETPILQASLLIVLNFLMVIYIVTLLPHQKMITNIEVVGYEIMIFIANVTCLRIATLEPAQQPNAVVAGDVILVSNIIIIAFSMLICVLKVLLKVLPIIEEKFAERKKKSIQTDQTPFPLQTPTEDCLPSPEKSPKHTEVEGESLLVVPDEDIDSPKIDTKPSSPMRPLDMLGKMESNRELLKIE